MNEIDYSYYDDFAERIREKAKKDPNFTFYIEIDNLIPKAKMKEINKEYEFYTEYRRHYKDTEEWRTFKKIWWDTIDKADDGYFRMPKTDIDLAEIVLKNWKINEHGFKYDKENNCSRIDLEELIGKKELQTLRNERKYICKKAGIPYKEYY